MKNGQSIWHIYPVGQKYHRNRSISHGLGDTSNFKFYYFCQKFKMAAIFGKRKNFWELSYLACIPSGSNISPKIQNGRHFWKEEKFLRLEQSMLHIYPVGQKFCRNRSISHGLGDTSNFKFYHFCEKFENSKWLPFLDRGKLSCLDTLWAKNFAKIIICELFVMNTK